MKCLIRLDPSGCYRLQYLASLPVQCVDADLFGAAPFVPLRAVRLNSILMNRIAAYARHLLMVCAFMTMSIAGCASDGTPSGGIEAALTLDPDALVTPFVEELFVRSWLLRYVDVFDNNMDFRDVPIARFGWPSFITVVVFFTISHVPWEWPVAVLWVVGSQLWFYHRKHLASLVIVHAGSNLSIFFFVLAMSGQLSDRAGMPIDLWFFI